MLKICGAVLLAIGLAAGVALVLSPFGIVGSARSSFTAWVMFPGCFAAGSLLLALAARNGAIDWLWRVCSALLLGLATASALALALLVLGILETAGHTLSLWYVLFVAGAIGTACALVPGAAATPS